MITRILALLALSTFLSASQVAANPFTYECEIKDAKAPNDNGALEPSDWTNLYINRKFHVSKETGHYEGIGVSNSRAMNVKVLSHGSKQNSFLVMSLWFGGVETLRIQQFVDTALKPFVLSDYYGHVFSGLCSQ